MEEVFVIGHKNPDTDSVCSAYCYANLKNRLDKSRTYIPVRCGNINKQTKFVFEKFGLSVPLFMNDIYPRVADVMTSNVVTVNLNDPIMTCMKNTEELKIGITPVVSENSRLEGIVSFLEVTEFFISRDLSKKPEYLIRPENFGKALKGYFHKKGENEEFQANLAVGAMPYEKFEKRMQYASPERTVLIVGKRKRIIDYAIANQFPALIITGMEDKEELDIDFTGYKGWVFISELGTAETLSLAMLSAPIKSIMSRKMSVVKRNDDLDYARELLMKADHKGLPVVEENRLEGIITRMNFLRKKRKKVIMVDHNEFTQSVDGSETAEIIEIIDHHRLGTIKTKTPIYVYAKPVGSTSTLIYQLFRINGVDMEKNVAALLLSGILSDTIVLKSPTTTGEDIDAANELSLIAGMDQGAYGVELFSATDNLGVIKSEAAINSDIKLYDEYGVKVGISQVEVVNMEVFGDVKKELKSAMEDAKRKHGLDWVMLLVTDIIKGESILLTTGFEPAERLLGYKRVESDLFHLPGVLSRKKQLLPEILRVLEDLAQK